MKNIAANHDNTSNLQLIVSKHKSEFEDLNLKEKWK